jgi:hypothetical protein
MLCHMDVKNVTELTSVYISLFLNVPNKILSLSFCLFSKIPTLDEIVAFSLAESRPHAIYGTDQSSDFTSQYKFLSWHHFVA